MALESLESTLDLCVITLNSLTKITVQRDHEIIVQTPRQVRDYRRRYPRRSEFDTSRLDKSVANKAYKMRQKAQMILGQVQ